MIAKMTKGKGFKGVLAYLLEGSKPAPMPRGNLILTNMTGNTPISFAREFGRIRSLRTGISKAVSHVSISLSPKDRSLNDEDFSLIAERFLDEMGYQNCPFVVVRHHDTEHQHIHIVTSRITLKGEVVSDAHDYRRAEVVMRQLEEDYGLHPPAERMTTNQNNQGEITMKNELREKIEEAMGVSSNTKQFIEECRKREIYLLPHIQGKRMNGIAYRYKKQRIKGSDLGKRYAWQFLSIALKYNSDNDFNFLQYVKEEEEENTPQVSVLEMDNRKRREHVRRLLEEEYEIMLREHFGERLQDISRTDDALTITLNDGVKITDYGDRITAVSDKQPEGAKAMVELAKKKGWQGIQFSGNREFLLVAMTEALKSELEVVPKNEMQVTVLEEIKRAINANLNTPTMGERVEPDQIGLRINNLRKRFGIENEDSQDTPNNHPRKIK